MFFSCLVPGLQAGEDGDGQEETGQCVQGLLLGGEVAQHPALEENWKHVEVIPGGKFQHPTKAQEDLLSCPGGSGGGVRQLVQGYLL